MSLFIKKVKPGIKLTPPPSKPPKPPNKMAVKLTKDESERIIIQCNRALEYIDKEDNANLSDAYRKVGYAHQTILNIKKQLKGEHPIM